MEIELSVLLIHRPSFAMQKVLSLTPVLNLPLDWGGTATVSVFYNFENHHILKVTLPLCNLLEIELSVLAKHKVLYLTSVPSLMLRGRVFNLQ